MIEVTLGNGVVFGIDADNDMFIAKDSEPGSRIYLGKATIQNFWRLKDNMDRLSVHLLSE